MKLSHWLYSLLFGIFIPILIINVLWPFQVYSCLPASALIVPLPFLGFSWFLNILNLLRLTASTKSSWISHNILPWAGLQLLSHPKCLCPSLPFCWFTYSGVSPFQLGKNYLPNYIWAPSLQRIYVR